MLRVRRFCRSSDSEMKIINQLKLNNYDLLQKYQNLNESKDSTYKR